MNVFVQELYNNLDLNATTSFGGLKTPNIMQAVDVVSMADHGAG